MSYEEEKKRRVGGFFVSLPFNCSGRGAEALAGVFFRRDVVAPGTVFQVPGDGFGEARFEGLLGLPAELALQLGAVDRVAAVVAGPVGHVGDLCGEQ